MLDGRKFSIFISSTFEDLKEERQALFSVALENGFIPVGMEQFHGAPTSQWNVVTKMIDECDFYLIMLGGRYGSIDESSSLSYTEKEYNYAKKKNIPILVLIKEESSITENKKDVGDKKYEKMMMLFIVFCDSATVFGTEYRRCYPISTHTIPWRTDKTNGF